MDKLERPIKTLGEIALQVINLQIMQEFYENAFGLELMKRFENIAFFKIAQGFEGHTQILVLSAESLPPDHKSRHFSGMNAHTTTLHHIAFAISLADFASEKRTSRTTRSGCGGTRTLVGALPVALYP